MQSNPLLLLIGALLTSTASASPAQKVYSSSWNSWSSAAAAPSATLDSGVVIGKSVPVSGSNTQVNQFLGIPFAQPPIGDLRFAPPRAPKSWSQPRSAAAYSATCIQEFGANAQSQSFSELLFNTPPPTPNVPSEDCLYLNVYVPDGGSNNKSTMFWIYGGGFDFGTGSLPLYDGTNMAGNQDIIVVTFNYRMNVFGYPMSPQLPLTERNLGHLDQRLALDWVQKNIHAFGGDPNKVAIAGQSAGATSVDDLITSMPKSPPFIAAILESGQDTVRTASLLQQGNPTNYTYWTHLTEVLNCSTGASTEVLDCMRAVSADLLLNITEEANLMFGPIFDNVTRLENPLSARQTGNVAKIPILTGSNYDDGTTFTTTSGNNVTSWLESFLSFSPSIAEGTAQLYAPGSVAAHGLTNGSQIIARIYTDMTFLCPSIFLSNITTKYDSSPAWLYLFNATFPNTQVPQYPQLGVYHTSEIPIIWGTDSTANRTSQENELSQYMQTAWANFVKDPRAGPGWGGYPQIEVFTSDPTPTLWVTTNATGAQAQVCPSWIALYT